jgi:hypothetical protein
MGGSMRAGKSIVLLTLAAGDYPGLCIAFTDSFIAEGEADDTIVILQLSRVCES